MKRNLLLILGILMFIPGAIASTCPSRVDIVFVVDTSGTMNDEWITLCSIMEDIVKRLENMGTNVEYDIYALGTSRSCGTSMSCSTDVIDTITLGVTCPATCNHGDREQWGPGVEWVAKNHAWRQNSQRIIFVISDEGSYCGGDSPYDPTDPVDSVDWDAMKNATNASKTNDVTVFGLWGDGSSNNVKKLLKNISEETGGEAQYFGDADSVTFTILNAVCGCIIPTFLTKLEKKSGELFDSSWSRTFMLTPFLEDMENCWPWTKTGEGTLYDGSGFERPDICKFACDAKKDCDSLDEGSLMCNSAFREGTSTRCGGSGEDECSHCVADRPGAHCLEGDDCTYVKDTCTELPGDEVLGEMLTVGPTPPCHWVTIHPDPEGPPQQVWVCPAPGMVKEEDCFNVCKIIPKGYRLEADYHSFTRTITGPVCSGDWYGIPYELEWDGPNLRCCPEGSDIEEIEVYPHTWGGWGDPAPDSYKIKKCVYPYGTMLGVTSFTIPDTDIDDGTPVDKDKIEENKWEITHPAFTLIETGNMPFEITHAYLSKSGDTYTITRIYKPQDSDREFIVNSDLVFNYNLFDTANELKIDAEHKYISMLWKEIHYVACDEEVCDHAVCSGQGSCTCEDFTWKCVKMENATYKDKYVGCGGESKDRHSRCVSEVECDCGEDGSGCSCSCREDTRLRRRIEKETEFIEDVSTTTQHITIPHVSHSNISDNTQINITGVIDQFVDDEGNREISGTINVTLDPDILRMFIFQVNNSTISYFPIVYPVKHYLYKKFSSPGDTTKVYTHHDSYGYEREEFDFNEVCKRECPSPRCWCPPDDRFDVTCINDTGGEFKPNEDSDPSNDCVCPQSDCYPDPCKSKRNFHEEQGIRIRNGDFEKPLEYCCPPPLMPGECFLKYGSCPTAAVIEYKEYKNWAVTKGTVTRVPNGFSGYCVKLEDNGWIKQRITPIPLHTFPYNELCFMYAVEECEEYGYLSLYVNGDRKFNLKCNDYKPLFCDLPSGWNRECVEIEDEISSIEFRSNNIKVYLDNVNLGEYYDFVGLYTENRSSMKKYFDIGFKDYDFTGFLAAKTNVRQNKTDHKTTYTFDFNTLKISIINSTGGLEEYTLTAKDIEENANITIYSHFRNITIDLFPPRVGNPYVNVTIREASKIDYEFDREPWNIKPGEIVTGRLTLTYYDTGIPIGNQPIYIESGSGKVEFLSPPSLVNDGYVTTDANGVANFTFKIHCFDILYFYFPGTMMAISPATNPVSPDNAEAPVGSTEFRSPFFHGDFLANFLILILILIFILFSYRFFKRRRTDFGEWWRILKGEE